MANNFIGILLAAGQSKRFGSNKLLHTLPDSKQTIAYQSASNLLRVLPHSIAIVNDNKILKEELARTGINVIENHNASLGISSSIVRAIQHTMDTDGWVITLADMPYIPETIYQRVIDELNIGHKIVTPTFNQQQGHPVGFARKFAKNLLNLKGDRGAKTIIDNNLTDLCTFETHSPEILKDVDVPDDIQQL